jgi:hypothetical protein
MMTLGTNLPACHPTTFPVSRTAAIPNYVFYYLNTAAIPIDPISHAATFSVDPIVVHASPKLPPIRAGRTTLV